MIGFLTDKNWYYTGSCNCGGTLNQKYKNEAYRELEIRIKPNRNKFEIKKYGKNITGGNADIFEQEYNRVIDGLKFNL